MNRRIVLWLVIVFAVYLLSAVWLVAPEQATWPIATSFSTQPDGTKALYTLFKMPPAKGSDRIEIEPQTQLIQEATLLLIEPSQDDSASAASAWLRMARSGRHIIELSNQPTPLMSALHVKIATVASRSVKNKATKQLWVTKVTAANVATIFHTNTQTWNLYVPRAAPTLLSTKRSDIRYVISKGAQSGQVVGITRKIGRGEVSLMTLPTISYNAWIDRKDNLPLLLSIVRPALHAVGFVETIHGFATTPGASAILGNSLQVFWLGLIVALAIWLWAEGPRFGVPIDDELKAPEAASYELIVAIARHYKKIRNLQPLLDNLHLLAVNRKTELMHPAEATTDKRAFINAVNQFVVLMADADKTQR